MMYKRVKNMEHPTTVKLICRRGASLMIALVIFLLCALAGASALIMAASNAGRLSHSDERQYYSVSSAALLFVDYLEGFEYTSAEYGYDYLREWEYDDAGKQHVVTDGYTLHSPREGSVSSTAHASTIRGSGLGICPKIKEQCDKVVPFLSIPNEWYEGVKDTPGAPARPAEEEVGSLSYSFEITMQDDESRDPKKYGTVYGNLVMNENYDLIFTFNGGDSNYAITVYWVADVEASITTGTASYNYTDYDETLGEYRHGSLSQQKTLKVIVTWEKENVTISRGEAING